MPEPRPGGRTAPRTMILFDPGLTSGKSRGSDAAQEFAAGGLPEDSRLRLPTARTLARFLAAAQPEVRLRGQVSVLLTGDAEIRRLNRRFRGINRPTDVLSFPPAGLPIRGERIAGDLAISIPTARRQAAEHGHSLLKEIKILILHGLLHLAGYDHHEDNGEMDSRERRLRIRLKLPPGLIERAGNGPATSPMHKARGAAVRIPIKGRPS